MKGFFEKDTMQVPYKSEKGRHSCISCGLYKSANTPRMKPYGKFGKKIMVISDSPENNDDEKGIPFQGKAGRSLKYTYKELGIDLFEDCICLNSVNCKTLNNEAPTEFEIACCRQKVLNVVNQYKPHIIILHGSSAISSLISYKWQGRQSGITNWAGHTIPDKELNAWVCPTYHPSYIDKQQQTNNEVKVWWENDLRTFFNLIDVPLPSYEDENDCIEIGYEDDIEHILTKLNDEEPELMAFDIETTGLKPHDKSVHKIVTISFCHDIDKAYAIPFPTQTKDIKLLKYLLKNPKIGKIAANMKFEDTWMKVHSNITVQPWAFDTMQAAHVLDNRTGITGLKFQSYVQFGVIGYENAVSPYLKSKYTNIPNRIMELTKDRESFNQLLLYNGIDSLLEFRLALKQMKEIGGKYENV